MRILRRCVRLRLLIPSILHRMCSIRQLLLRPRIRISIRMSRMSRSRVLLRFVDSTV